MKLVINHIEYSICKNPDGLYQVYIRQENCYSTTTCLNPKFKTEKAALAYIKKLAK